MNYSVAEFRKNIRVALDAVERGELVCIKRHDKTFILLTMSDYNEAIVSAAKDGVSRLVTDEVSSNIRPDIQRVAKVGDKAFVANGVDPVKKIDLATPKRDKLIEPNSVGGKSCCYKDKRCQHWQWNDEQGVWQNALTGGVRSVE